MTNRKYTATLFDGHAEAGRTTILAGSWPDAADRLIEWAEDGDWDHPGCVEMRVRGPGGVERTYTVTVGEEKHAP